MSELRGFQAVIEHFKRQGWRYQLDEGRPILRAEFACKNSPVRLIAAVEESDDLLQVFTVMPTIVPVDQRPAVAELVTRTSWGLKMGRFELDFDRGELRFQASTPYVKGELGDPVLTRTLAVSLMMADMHFPAFMAVLYGNIAPAQALEQVRSPIAAAQAPPAPQALPAFSRARFN